MNSIKNLLRFILPGIIIQTMIFYGCTKDDDPIIPQDDTPKLKKESYFGTLTDTIPWTYNLYEYDNSGNLIKKTGYSGTPEDYISGYTTYEYDSENKLIKESHYAGDNLELWIYLIYTYSGTSLIKKEIFNGNNEFKRSSNYEYDNRGNRIKSWQFDPDQGIYQVAYFEYDENNNRIKEIGSSAYWIHEYDEQNRKISTKTYGLQDSTLHTHYTYDYQGNLLIRHNYHNNQTGEVYFKTEYFYDSNDNLIEVIDERDGIRNTLKTYMYENNLLVEYIGYDRMIAYKINMIIRYEYYIK